MLDLNKETLDIKWECPECNAVNQDNYLTTVFPQCKGTQPAHKNLFDWSDILDNDEMRQVELAYRNAMMKG